MNDDPPPWSGLDTHGHDLALSRRAFLRSGTLFLLAASGSSLGGRLFAAEAPAPALRIGLVTDVHYADRPPQGARHYRESLDKLREAVARFNTPRPDFAVELGDFIDEAPTVEG